METIGESILEFGREAMASIYSVGQVNAYIKNMFNADFALNNIYIKR